MVKIGAFLGAALAAAAGLQAAEGAAFLKIPHGAKSSAMAGAYSMQPASLETLWYNPAGLAGLASVTGSWSHLSWIGGINDEYACLGLPLGGGQTIGMMVDHDTATDTYRDSTGAEFGSFSISNSAAGLAYAASLGMLRLGLQGKWLGSKVEAEEGGGFAADLGAIASWWQGKVSLGVALQNIGQAPAFSADSGVAAPLTLRAGLGLAELLPGLGINQELRWLAFSRQLDYALAGEYGGQVGGLGGALRAGYDFGQADIGGLAGLSLGLGCAWGSFELDYAWVPLDLLGDTQRVSLQVAFGPGRP